MKKIVLLLASILILSFANAQFYVETNLIFTDHEKVHMPIDFGYGIQLNTGYSLSEKVALGISTQHLWFSCFKGYTIKSLEAQAKYYLLTKSIRPFVSIKAGIFQEKFPGIFQEASAHVPEINIPDAYINSFGVSPSVGILFTSGIHENLYVNTELTYSHIFAEREVRLIAFGIGFKYVFN
jgi:hypothetical protein